MFLLNCLSTVKFCEQVAQQSMWGRENDPSQKGMNFASVAATGAPSTGPQPLPNMHSYLESSPPQV